jgi:hypothetical protein
VKIVARLARDGHQTSLAQVLVLAMAPPLAIEVPSVLADQPEYFRHLHAGQCGSGRHRAARRMESVRRALRRCAVIIFLGAAPCRDESRDRASANRSPESFINGFVLTLKGLTLAR